MGKLLYTIQEVFSNDIHAVIGSKKYNIPNYQRGYKWKPQQVRQLLNDINKFEPQANGEQFYCLQNITLIDKLTGATQINVVDGQQRLTTSLLLLRYLGQTSLIKDKLIYEIREISNTFLKQLVDDQSGYHELILESADFTDFLTKVAPDFDYQDIYFMFTSYRTISDWFVGKEHLIESFTQKLLQHVKMIINHVVGVKEKELFMNLNSGRVHLDGADLIRAIIITRVAKQEIDSFDPSNTQHIVKLNEKRLRIGLQLDELNAWWSLPQVKAYFSIFSKVKVSPSESIRFNQEDYPINLLYKLWVKTRGNDTISLSCFESQEESVLQLFYSVLDVHRVLKHWFENRSAYHFIGFLLNNTKTKFGDVWEMWKNNSKTVDEFISNLKSEIKLKIFGEGNDEEDEGYDFWMHQIEYNESELDKNTNWYQTDMLAKILLLVDIIKHTKDEEKGNKLPFLAPHLFKQFKEDKEHIYPSTPQELKVLEEEETPILKINDYITELNNQGVAVGRLEINDQQWNELDREKKQRDYDRLKSEIHLKSPINSIGNLVLLNLSINRGFGNNSYDLKRIEVLKNTRSGHYVRKHTQDVFVKHKLESDLNRWTMDDIKNNSKHIKESLVSFFKEPL